MGLIYQNYNRVILEEQNGIKRTRKIFGNKFCWQNETNSIKILSANGIPVPRLVSTEYLKNTYEFVDYPSFEQVLRDNPKGILPLLDFTERFYGLPHGGFFKFDDRKGNIDSAVVSLIERGQINSALANKIKSVSDNYLRTNLAVVHGDFRPANFFGRINSVDAVIDFEFTGIDDPNKDLAYLWVGAVGIDKSLNRVLKEQFRRKDYYNQKAFEYWLTYVHLMIAINPRNKNVQSWITNLRQILNDA